MSEERLHFVGPATPPHAMTAAEHLARYAVVAPFVRGKRVLDIACGEGYGSWFLKEWGACEVVGIDISAEAITVARKRFGREGVVFDVGDACRARDFLEHAGFDLIVSFETVEHVADPQAFLEGLRALATPGASIFISCPNDHAAMPAAQSNPFHLRKYTFEEFQLLSESILGKGAQWLLGANVQGYALIPDGDPVASDAWEDWRDIVKTKSFAVSQLLPSQANIRPNRSNVLYYLGVWGEEKAATSVAVSAQSYTAFIEPWQTIDWLKAGLSQADSRMEEMGKERSDPRHDPQPACQRSSRELAETRHRLLVLASELEKEKQNLHNEKKRAASLEAEMQARGAQLTAILNSRSWQFTKLARLVRQLTRGDFESVRASVSSFIKKISSKESP
jgi:SAM-dependent methyltransferase